VRNCKLCKLHRLCNDIPAFCFVLHYLALILVIGLLAFFFFRSDSGVEASANSPLAAPVAPVDSR
jgi:hypothetical protein